MNLIVSRRCPLVWSWSWSSLVMMTSFTRMFEWLESAGDGEYLACVLILGQDSVSSRDVLIVKSVDCFCWGRLRRHVWRLKMMLTHSEPSSGLGEEILGAGVVSHVTPVRDRLLGEARIQLIISLHFSVDVSLALVTWHGSIPSAHPYLLIFTLAAQPYSVVSLWQGVNIVLADQSISLCQIGLGPGQGDGTMMVESILLKNI